MVGLIVLQFPPEFKSFLEHVHFYRKTSSLLNKCGRTCNTSYIHETKLWEFVNNLLLLVTRLEKCTITITIIRRTFCNHRTTFIVYALCTWINDFIRTIELGIMITWRQSRTFSTWFKLKTSQKSNFTSSSLKIQESTRPGVCWDKKGGPLSNHQKL